MNTLYLGGEDFEIRTRFDAGRSGDAASFQDRESALCFLRRALADLHSISVLRGLAADTLLFVGRDDDEMLEQLSWLLFEGSLRIVRLPKEALGGSGEATEVELARVEGRAVKDWVEIVLLDDDDNPVAGAEYEMTLPDGSLETGRTNSAGKARFTGIDPGVCKVSFVRLDERAWNRA
jgi:hypothetical protein